MRRPQAGDVCVEEGLTWTWNETSNGHWAHDAQGTVLGVHPVADGIWLVTVGDPPIIRRHFHGEDAGGQAFKAAAEMASVVAW